MSQESEQRRIAQAAVRSGMPLNAYCNALKETDWWSSRAKAKAIYQDEQERYSRDERLARGRKESIDYDGLNTSRTDIVSEYSFTVQKGYLVDENGRYIRDAYGNKVGNYITVRSNRLLTRSQIIEAAEKKKLRTQGSGKYSHKGRTRIVSGMRRK